MYVSFPKVCTVPVRNLFSVLSTSFGKKRGHMAGTIFVTFLSIALLLVINKRCVYKYISREWSRSYDT